MHQIIAAFRCVPLCTTVNTSYFTTYLVGMVIAFFKGEVMMT